MRAFGSWAQCLAASTVLWAGCQCQPRPDSDGGTAADAANVMLDGAVHHVDAGGGDAARLDAGGGLDAAGNADAQPGADAAVADAASMPDAAVQDAAVEDAAVGVDAAFVFPDAGPGGYTCTSCHGGAGNPAPPRDLHNFTSTTLRTVGAHQTHLRTTALFRTVVCSECHTVPQDLMDPGHVDDGAPAEVHFGPLAGAHDVATAFDGMTCATYCHGESLQAGGTNTRPAWTGLNQAQCGACHAVPPPQPHPVVPALDCSGCHPFTGMLPNDPQRHVDGVLDLTASCMTCHGDDATGPAPPRDTHGQRETTQVGVGAHASHLRPSTWRAQVGCTQCHRVPGSIADPAHLDGDGRAEVLFGPLANARDVASLWNGVNCTTYCHGANLSAGSNTQPLWTTVDGTQAACGSCHGLPPTARNHPQSTNCSACHGEVVDAQGTFVAPQLHINGNVELTGGCTACHGDAATGPAPPRDTHGNTNVSATGVGAHAAHLAPSNWHLEVTCNECHQVPSQPSSAGHLDGDGVAEVTLGGLATANGVMANWTGTTCATYCHGPTLTGGSVAQPQWTAPSGTQAVCGACHGLPPNTHTPQDTLCSTCHGAVVDASNQFVDPRLHINGVVDAQVSCGSCHGVPPPTGSHLIHAVGAAPAYGALGTAAETTTPGVYALGCGQCHPRDVSRHRNGGLAEIELYDPTAPAGSLKAMHPPNATYVPGTTQLLDDKGRAYTLGSCSNVYCHSGVTTASDVPPVPGVDFAFTGYPVLYPSFNVQRTRSYQQATWGTPTGCNGCHGNPPRGQYPASHAAAGESHAYVAQDGKESLHAFNHGAAPLQCRTCHVSTVAGVATYARDGNGVTTYGPTAIGGYVQHVNGQVDVGFDVANPITYPTRAGPVSMDLHGAVYDPANTSCSNVACHQGQTNVRAGLPYRPQHARECNTCHQF